ncbi:MAG TPA: class I SAM-dependent methyltransferase, partial [Rhizobiales bacterium]|nr:class I SAM-dependent methyltransferase [Hyphomicrobiales bacterium]
MTAPSAWIRRFSPLIRNGGDVLDLACGQARHTVFFQQLGCRVTAVDRDIRAVAKLDGVTGLEVELEDGSPWPLEGRRFDAV